MAVPFSRLKFYEAGRGPRVEALIFFPNRYGANVYQRTPAYGDTYSVAVIRALKPRPKDFSSGDYEIVFDTPVMDRILENQTREDVENVLGEIAALPPRSLIDRIEFDGAELDAASHWYGGQGSMLYAITSTGHLARGTHRPWNPDEDRPMTDDEWLASLARSLAGEAEGDADSAAERAEELAERRKDEDLDEEELEELEKDLEELLDDEVGLRSIAQKAARVADELDPEQD